MENVVSYILNHYKKIVSDLTNIAQNHQILINFLEDKALITEKVIGGVETKQLSGFYGVTVAYFLIFCYYY